MYNCDICKKPSPPGQRRLVLVHYREVTNEFTGRAHREISWEQPLCAECFKLKGPKEAVEQLLASEKQAAVQLTQQAKEPKRPVEDKALRPEVG